MSNEASRKAFDAWILTPPARYPGPPDAWTEMQKEDDLVTWNASRKALEAEQAQSVEPVLYQQRMKADWSNSWTAWEECSEATFKNVLRVPSLHDWTHQARALYTHPAPPPAEPTVKKPLSTERAGLIAWQHDLVKKYISLGYEGLAQLCKQTADMLEADVSLINEGNKAQQVAVNQGCQYPVCHSETYQQAVTAQITAELWSGVVVPPGYALVPIEPTAAMIVAGRCAPCPADGMDNDENYRVVYQDMLAAAPQPPQGDKT